MHTFYCCKIRNGNALAALGSLGNMLNSGAIDLVSAVYLFSDIVNRLGNQMVKISISEVCEQTHTENVHVLYNLTKSPHYS